MSGSQQKCLITEVKVASPMPVAMLHTETEVPVEQVQVDIRQQRGNHSPNAKGNFQFERVVVGWRSRAALDLRRK